MVIIQILAGQLACGLARIWCAWISFEFGYFNPII